jgi:hydrogenase/urease accessory protein HupE
MESTNYNTLNDDDLIAEVKKLKKENTIRQFMIGFLIATFCVGVYNKGVKAGTLVPLFFVGFLLKGSNGYTSAKQELDSRNITKE